MLTRYKDDENCSNSNLDVKFDGDNKKCKNEDGGNDGDGSERNTLHTPSSI